jgi:gamma-glutamylcyclotransferase (GGCT)/AIG2-like uncharacterized protein YtfP
MRSYAGRRRSGGAGGDGRFDRSRLDGSSLHGAAGDDAPAPDDAHIHVFVYGTLRGGAGSAKMLDGCVRVADATVEGTLYDFGEYPALMLYGATPVQGEVWRCPAEKLGQLDAYEGVSRGLFRRIAVEVAGIPCWAWVAGPALARRLTPDRRMSHGVWNAG